MRFIDLIEILICFVIIFVVIYWGVNSDNELQKSAVELNKQLDNIEIYNNCYEISGLYYCIKEVK